jgi:thiol-disulfide isomerase/thioredoxin
MMLRGVCGVLVLVAVALLACAAQGVEAFYGKTSDVTVLSGKKWKSVLNSPHVAIVELYREGCGHCVNLRPEYEKAAKALKGLVQVTAVDVEKNRDMAGKVQSWGKFQVKGVPTLKVIIPDKKDPTNPKKKKVIDYNGERKASAIIAFMHSHMPNFVDSKATKSVKALDTFREANEFRPHVLAFGKSAGPSALIKGLATHFYKKVDFSYAPKSAKKIREEFDQTSPAGLLVWPAGADKDGFVKFTKKPSYKLLENFLHSHFVDAKKRKKELEEKEEL